MEAIEINTAKLASAFMVIRRLIDTVSKPSLRERLFYFYFSFNERELVITSSMCNEATLSITIPYQNDVILPESVHIKVWKHIFFMVNAIWRKEGKIVLKLNEDRQTLNLEYSTGSYKMQCQVLSQRDIDIRRQDVYSTIRTAKIDADVFAKGVGYTAGGCSGFCTSTGPNLNKIMGYIHVEIQDGHTEFVGTNGKELTHYKVESAESQSLSCNIHSKFEDVLQKLMRYGLDTVSTDGLTVLFSSDTYRFTCPTSMVAYPNYRKILQNFEEAVICTTIPFRDMAHAVALVNSNETDTTVITVEVTEKSVRVTGVDLKKSAKATETIPHMHSDSSFTFSVYGSSLAKTLKIANGNELTISFVGKNKPILISSDDKNLSVVLLPTESLLKE